MKAPQRLLVVQGPDIGTEISLEGRDELVIGRGPRADLRLTDKTTSSAHCRVSLVGSFVGIEDLGSSNGTRVNGESISSLSVDGPALIEIGSSAVELLWPGKPRLKLAQAPGPEATEAQAAATFVNRLSGAAAVAEQAPSTGPEPTRFNAEKMLGMTIVGRKLEKVLGVGSLGMIFSAREPDGTMVVLKLLQFAQVKDPVALQNFLSETKAGKHLRHPQIAATLDCGADGSWAYLVQELVEGRTLNAWLKLNRRLKPSVTVAFAVPVCEALAYAHGEGVLHRSLKPRSILLLDSNLPKILNLGLANRRDARGASLFRESRSSSDAPPYMPPEQTVDAKHVDEHSDIYSLGATLYAALSGHAPFHGKDAPEIIRQARSTDAPRLMDIPERLAQAVAKAMHKNPKKRFASMAEMRDALKTSL